MKRKTVRVAAAILCAENEKGERMFHATQRGYGAFAGGWEFPGGKIEAGETPQEALVREIREELAIEIAVGELAARVAYDYPDFHLSMDCFFAKILSGELTLKEHRAARWLSRQELLSVDWLPADVELIERLRAGEILAEERRR